MSFYLSPLVDVNEIDLTTTVQAAAKTIGCIVLRDTYRGEEMQRTLCLDVNDLWTKFGYPNEKNYIDLLVAEGFLQDAQALYCTRVLPPNAKRSGIAGRYGYNDSFESLVTSAGWDRSAAGIDSPTFRGEYFNEEMNSGANKKGVNSLFEIDDTMWIIANSRGKWGDNLRVLVFDYELYNAIKYLKPHLTNPYIEYPSNFAPSTETATASAAAVKIYKAAQNSTDLATRNVYVSIKNSGITLVDKTEFAILVQLKGQGKDSYEVVESWHVSIDETAIDDQGRPLFCESVINSQSGYIRMALNPRFKITSEMSVEDRQSVKMVCGLTQYVNLTGGSDGVYGLGEKLAATLDAYNLYANPDEVDVNIFLDGDKDISIKQRLIDICENERKDAVAILDIPGDLVINTTDRVSKLIRWRRGFDGSTFNENSSYAAVYANWLEVYDKRNFKYRWIPACGHVGGIYARTDIMNDPWYAPAGLQRAVLRGVRRLAFNPTLQERDLLYVDGLNPIVSFSGVGKVVWGQKTLLDKNSAFNRVNVRRLFLTIEKAIATASKYYLFDPNDALTRSLLISMINPYLRGVQAGRGIYEYQIICDLTNNSPDSIDRGELRCDILIKPTRAAEFIILNFVATKTGASFDEVSTILNRGVNYATTGI